MAIPMTTLRRAPNGDWFARKGIPKDVRESYKAAYGVSQEERFRRPASMPLGRAKQELRDWDASVTARIEALRAKANGHGQSLTHREAVGLVGQWYSWFVKKHEEEPGPALGWEMMSDELEGVYSQFGVSQEEMDDPDWEPSPAIQRHLRAMLSSFAEVPRFLGLNNITLTEEATALFLDTLHDEFLTALDTLRRRSERDYTPDRTPERFPAYEPKRISGLTVWSAFEAWVKERKPGNATVNRWRAVFLDLQRHWGERDIASITEEDARAWKDTLVTESRSAQVAKDVWLRAAGIVFGWAKDNKKITANPFDGVTIAVPKASPKLREREFNDDEWPIILKATLNPPAPRMNRFKAAARRWVPWLCAYTGARPGEMTQLRAEDVRQDKSGFYFLRITPEAGTVKGGVAREVPLHPHIIEQGFLDYVQSVGSGPLFYDPNGARTERHDPTNPTRAPWIIARNKLAEWVRDLGVTDPNISPSHAWRHTFKRRAARAGIEKRIRWAICGHSSKEVGDEYERPTLQDMAVELNKFPRFELDCR